MQGEPSLGHGSAEVFGVGVEALSELGGFADEVEHFELCSDDGRGYGV